MYRAKNVTELGLCVITTKRTGIYRISVVLRVEVKDTINSVKNKI